MRICRHRRPGHARRRIAAVVPEQTSRVYWLSVAHGSLPAIFRYIREVAEAAVAARPDVLVIIDSPELTHRIARRSASGAPTIPIVDYVSPRCGRGGPGARAPCAPTSITCSRCCRSSRRRIARLGGPPCSYVGHPLIEQSTSSGQCRGGAPPANRSAGAPGLPGSRPGEIRRMTAVFGEAIGCSRARVGPFEVSCPRCRICRTRCGGDRELAVPSRVSSIPRKNGQRSGARGGAREVGTVTLELALSGVPMVAAYKVAPSRSWSRGCHQGAVGHPGQSGLGENGFRNSCSGIARPRSWPARLRRC